MAAKAINCKKLTNPTQLKQLIYLKKNNYFVNNNI